MRIQLSRLYRGFLRTKLNSKNKKKLKNTNFTILSSNCVAGVLYHELGLKFLSPTINMFMSPKDFIRFLRQPHKYFGVTMELIGYRDDYPIVRIDDIVVNCVHYKSMEEFQDKWNARAKRIQWDNLYVMMMERDGCTYEDLCEFDELPYEHKVVFVHKPMPEIRSAVYIEGTEVYGEATHKVDGLTTYQGKLTGKRMIDKWDYISFLNKK
ncbi:DUF1919 domain-containing protein [Aerococcaceae bacterium NML160702]|nr:DUF1919 domain-containing protein [Aerococcaceae bacterium NML160702]